MWHTYRVQVPGNSTAEVQTAGKHWCKWWISADVEIAVAYLKLYPKNSSLRRYVCINLDLFSLATIDTIIFPYIRYEVNFGFVIYLAEFSEIIFQNIFLLYHFHTYISGS
jgi:hypothetical protein